MGVCDSRNKKASVVRINRVNFRENISAFRRDKRNCSLYMGVRREGFHCTLLTAQLLLQLTFADNWQFD